MWTLLAKTRLWLVNPNLSKDWLLFTRKVKKIEANNSFFCYLSISEMTLFFLNAWMPINS
jgi:hypothetical protein